MSMTLKEFIEAEGDAACASLWNVKERTVASWRRGERFPRPAKANQIIESSGGRLTHASIYAAAGPSTEAA